MKKMRLYTNNFFKDFFEIKNRDEVHVFLKKYGYKILCEIGVLKGKNLFNLVKSDPIELWAIDRWDGFLANRYYQGFKEKIKKHKNIKVVKALSMETVNTFKNNYFDYIYIDASHEYKNVADDLHYWWPKLKIGGILGAHDYCEICPEVAKAVVEFMQEKNLNIKIITNDGKKRTTNEKRRSIFFLKYKN